MEEQTQIHSNRHMPNAYAKRNVLERVAFGVHETKKKPIKKIAIQ